MCTVPLQASYKIDHYILVIFPIVTNGAALIFSGAIAGTSILPTVVAGGLGLLGIGKYRDTHRFLFQPFDARFTSL